MNLDIDKSEAARVEYDIAPPMARAVTLPITLDGEDTGVSVYVAASPFSLRLNAKVFREVVTRLQLQEND